MNAASRLVFSASRYDQIMPLLHRLHWLRAPQRISFKLAVLAFRSLRGLAPTYQSDSMRHVADLPGRQRLRSASSADLAVPQTRLETVGDRAFCVAEAKTWNSLPSEVTSSVTLSTFKQKLKTYLFFTVIRLRNDLYCVEWGVKLYSLTHPARNISPC